MRVLDASALLAYLQDEVGADTVANALPRGMVISTVNLSEVATKLVDAGVDPNEASESLREGELGRALDVEPFTEPDSQACAALRPGTRPFGLSLGDRACLALGLRLGQAVLTADRVWTELDVGVTVELIREQSSSTQSHDDEEG
ncbi:MAG: type II toxin-antitoxin system VapC family toxin [Acidimicrobiales bacterium]